MKKQEYIAKENKLKAHLNSLTKEQLVELYLQKNFELEFAKLEERVILCDKIRTAYINKLAPVTMSYNEYVNGVFEILDQIEKGETL